MKLQLAAFALILCTFADFGATVVSQEPQAKPPSPTVGTGSGPTAKIDGPETWLIGSVPEFRDSSTSTKFRKWKVTPKPDSMKYYEGGTVLVIGSSVPKDFVVMLIVSNDNGLDFEEFDTRALAAVNTTPVTPLAAVAHVESEKPPLVDLLGGFSDTEELCYRWADEKLKSKTAAKEASIVAQVMRNARQRVQARSIATPEEMSAFTASGCIEALGQVAFGEWKQLEKDLIEDRPKFFDYVTEHVDRLTAERQLDTMEAYSNLWLECAKGLERFANQ